MPVAMNWVIEMMSVCKILTPFQIIVCFDLSKFIVCLGSNELGDRNDVNLQDAHSFPNYRLFWSFDLSKFIDFTIKMVYLYA